MNGERCHNDPANHGDRCGCGRPARWHVDCAIHGCGNFCGIHARAIQRKACGSAVFNRPNIIREQNMDLTEERRAALAKIAADTAEVMALEFGRVCVGRPRYSARNLPRGGWSVLIIGLTDDVERDAVEVFADGSHRRAS